MLVGFKSLKLAIDETVLFMFAELKSVWLRVEIRFKAENMTFPNSRSQFKKGIDSFFLPVCLSAIVYLRAARTRRRRGGSHVLAARHVGMRRRTVTAAPLATSSSSSPLSLLADTSVITSRHASNVQLLCRLFKIDAALANDFFVASDARTFKVQLIVRSSPEADVAISCGDLSSFRLFAFSLWCSRNNSDS